METDGGSRWTSCRMVCAYVSLIGAILSNIPRVLISAVLVGMTPQLDNPLKTNWNFTNTSSHYLLAGTEPQDIYEYEFHWSRTAQGLIVSAGSYGGLLGSLPAGWLSDVYGGKRVAGISMFAAGVALCLCPTAARIHVSVYFFAVLMVGFLSNVGGIGVAALVGTWAPVQERAFLTALRSNGAMFCMPVANFYIWLLMPTGFDGGWPAPLYFQALLIFLWLPLWFFLVYDTAEDHPRITQAEKDYLLNNGAVKKSKNVTVPWSAMLQSGPLWVLIFTALGFSVWTNFLFNLTPVYLNDLHVDDPLRISLYTTILSLPTFMLPFLMGLLVDFILVKGWLSLVWTRKLMFLIGMLTLGPTLLAISFVGPHQVTVAVILLTAATLFFQPVFSVSAAIFVDIAPRYSGILMALMYISSYVVGIALSPAVYSVTSGGTAAEWRSVYIFVAGTVFIGNLLYIIFGTAEVQPWAKDLNEISPLVGKDTESIRSPKPSTIE